MLFYIVNFPRLNIAYIIKIVDSKYYTKEPGRRRKKIKITIYFQNRPLHTANTYEKNIHMNQ